MGGGFIRVEMRDQSERIIIERIFSTLRDAESALDLVRERSHYVPEADTVYYRGTLVTDDAG